MAPVLYSIALDHACKQLEYLKITPYQFKILALIQQGVSNAVHISSLMQHLNHFPNDYASIIHYLHKLKRLGYINNRPRQKTFWNGSQKIEYTITVQGLATIALIQKKCEDIFHNINIEELPLAKSYTLQCRINGISKRHIGNNVKIQNRGNCPETKCLAGDIKRKKPTIRPKMTATDVKRLEKIRQDKRLAGL